MDHVTFTLIFWVTMGWRFEEMQLPLLYRDNCAVYRDEMLRERQPARAVCVQDPPRKPPESGEIKCAPCGVRPEWPRLPPGHKRV
jgi:hypothetical protein